MEDLVQTTYHSQATDRADMSRAALERLLLQARARNASLGLTGALLCGEDSFAQVIEGSRSAVRAVMQSISQDHRHTNLCLLRDEKIIETRAFANWAMAGLLWKDESSSMIYPILGVDAQSVGVRGDCLLATLKWLVHGNQEVQVLPMPARSAFMRMRDRPELLH